MNDFQPAIIADSMNELLEGAWVTLDITFVSFAIALCIGTIVGIARSKKGWLKIALAPYVELFRGTPLLIQLFFIYYALPALGFSLKNYSAAYIGIGLCGGSYISEIIRASLSSVPHGQIEAACSTGLNRIQTLLYVILPQAMRIALPPLMNSFASLLKETSLVSVLAINELTRSGQMVYSRTFRPFEIYVAVAFMYFFMTYAISIIARYLEKYFSKGGLLR